MKRKVIALATIAVALIQFSNTSATTAKKTEDVKANSEQLSCDELAKRLTVANRHIYMQQCL
ncbi:hypothetical protein [Alteromonas macleodii]|uniref:hypothetical protein n=1 Tax=Alteromonas macleodii TaxID=28108 RepID=UPI003140575B